MMMQAWLQRPFLLVAWCSTRRAPTRSWSRNFSHLPASISGVQSFMLAILCAAQVAGSGSACIAKVPPKRRRKNRLDAAMVASHKPPPLCHFYPNCRNGQSCPFLHPKKTENTTAASTSASAPPCRFFLAGTCSFGEVCRFSHTSGTRSGPSSSSLAQAPKPDEAAASSSSYTAAAGQSTFDWGRSGHGSDSAAAPGANLVTLPEDLGLEYLGLGADHEDDAWDEADDEIWALQQQQQQQAEAAGWQGEDANSPAWHPEGGGDDADVWAGPGPAHGNADGGMIDPSELPLCSRFTASGSCPEGDECSSIHGEVCETCGYHALHPYNPEEAEQHRTECRRRHDRLAARLRSAEVECGICLERVLAKPTPSDRRFGLLSCEHAFCLACIRGWRANGTADLDSAVRTCPLCRATTHFVVPSTVWPLSQQEKDDILSGYKLKLGAIHCRHFARGSGTCPFGTSCFYRHEHPDGTEESKDPALLRRYIGQEGEVRIVSGVRLCDFLDTQQGRRALAGPARRRG